MASYALLMKQQPTHLDVYQLRIVLRGISPLIWRRLLVRGDTTLAQLHLMLQLSFAWSNEHLHHCHIFGKDYGSDGADTRHITLDAFGFQKGERFRYVYNYYCHLTHKSATWAEICVTRAKLAKICVKFPLDFRFKLALRRALRRIAKVLYRPSAYD